MCTSPETSYDLFQVWFSRGNWGGASIGPVWGVKKKKDGASDSVGWAPAAVLPLLFLYGNLN